MGIGGVRAGTADGMRVRVGTGGVAETCHLGDRGATPHGAATGGVGDEAAWREGPTSMPGRVRVLGRVLAAGRAASIDMRATGGA
jgi:hypothetical protein